jgi:hypothetical protein
LSTILLPNKELPLHFNFCCSEKNLFLYEKLYCGGHDGRSCFLCVNKWVSCYLLCGFRSFTYASLMQSMCMHLFCSLFVYGFAPHILSDDIVLSANGLIASTAKVSAACTYPNGSCV